MICGAPLDAEGIINEKDRINGVENIIKMRLEK